MQIETWQWIVAGLGAFTIGVSKTGIAGLGILAIATFALAFPGGNSLGIVLVVLISADVIAVSTGGKHADWKHLRGLFPWAAGGVIIGALALGRIHDAAMQHLIGVILLVLVALQFLRSRNAKSAIVAKDAVAAADAPASADAPAIADISSSPFFAPVMGLLAGFTTMVANAAGPLMILYLLAMRLPKARFIGTAAWFFLVMNLFKVPFSVYLKIINASSLPISLALAPCAMVGAFAGRLVLHRIDQKLFETLALALTFCAAVKLLF